MSAHYPSHVANETKTALGVEKLDAVADRGYFNREEFLACEEADITVTLPKPMTSNAKAEGRFGKQDFRYVADEDVYLCPAGEKLAYSFTTQDKGMVLRRYRTTACHSCAIKNSCTKGKERLISRWEHEHILEAVQRRLDEHPEKMRQRRETVEHPFGRLLKEPDSELRCRRRPCPRRSTARQRRESNRPSPSDRALGNRDTSNCIQAGRPRWLPANSWP